MWHHEVAHRVVRRGVDIASDAFYTAGSSRQAHESYVAQLKADAQVYEDGGRGMEVQPWQFFSIVAIALIFVFVLFSVDYTVGNVVATLAMVEQPTTTVISETRIAADYDPDAPIEKAPLDEEIVVVKEEPVTRSIRGTVKYLKQVGGSKARWRGFAISVVYQMLLGLCQYVLTGFLAVISPLLCPLAFIIASILTARIHMTWTHIMITPPSDKPWYRRVPKGRKYFKALALPTFVFAAAQQLTVVVPAAVFFLAEGGPRFHANLEQAWDHLSIPLLCSVLAGGATALLILLPASVTLTRIEASLLAEDEDTIVSFDRTLNGAVPAAIALNEGRSAKSLFIEAWRSFDRASRIRLIKFYVKYFMIQLFVVIAGIVSTVAALIMVGPQKIANLVKAGNAQLQLQAMGEDM